MRKPQASSVPQDLQAQLVCLLTLQSVDSIKQFSLVSSD